MTLSLDLIYSLRLTRKNLGFVSLCSLVIALGFGLSITIYSTINTFAYKPMPFPDGDKFAVIQSVDKATGDDTDNAIDSYLFQRIQPSIQSFDIFGAYRQSSVTLSDGELAEKFTAAYLTPNLLGIPDGDAILGRNLTIADDSFGAGPVVLISEQVWRNYYRGREDIIGNISRINGQGYTIVGVMPEKYNLLGTEDLWLPLQLPSNIQPENKQRVRALGILADAADIESASAEVSKLILDIGRELPEFYGNLSAQVDTYKRAQGPPMAFWHTLSAVTLTMLLLVCLNVTKLLVVRSNERVQELAIRSALGASLWRQIQSVLLDSLLICLAGAMAGLVLANLCMSLFNNMFAEMQIGRSLPDWAIFGWDVSTAFVALLILLCIWLFSGGLAAWKVARQDTSSILAAGGGKGLAGSVSKMGKTIVGFEVVFSCFLLVLSGVFVGSALDLTRSDYGTATEGYITGLITLPESSYTDTVSQTNYQRDLRNQLQQNPAFESVTFTSAIPSQDGESMGFTLADRSINTENGYPTLDVVYTSPNYFEIMDVNLLAGRTFGQDNVDNNLPEIIVDEIFAKAMWPNELAIGKQIQLKPELSTPWFTIVGVINHIQQDNPVNGTDVSSFYIPFSQQRLLTRASVSNDPFWIVARLNPVNQQTLAEYQLALREEANSVDRDVPISQIYLLSDIIQKANSLMYLASNTFSFNAFITLVLAITGIFALVSRSVRQRLAEVGIRRVVGSSNSRILWLFIQYGLKFLFIGLLVGGGSAVIITNLAEGGFPGIVEQLPRVFVSVSIVLTALMLLATYKPATKLIAKEPGDALRYE